MSQLFGMDFSQLTNRVSNANEKKTGKAESSKNQIGNPKLSEKAASYYESLKEKYGDVEFILVDDKQVAHAKDYASHVNSDKRAVVVISESEVEAMATDEATRSKNETFIADFLNGLPEYEKKLEETNVDVKHFGMEIKDDGTLNFFAILKKGNKTIQASTFEELLKKLQDSAMEEKSDTVMTEKEKMVGQHVDLRF